MQELLVFFKNSIENKPILSRRYDCPESMILFKNSIENKPILSRRYDCPEWMLFFKNSIENESILSRRCGCPESMLFFKNLIENKFIRLNRFFTNSIALAVILVVFSRIRSFKSHYTGSSMPPPPLQLYGLIMNPLKWRYVRSLSRIAIQ